ncbi:gp114 [Ruegeria phage DSS3-P1]|nr:gp114 [Ruegeria phage DSS3-P1]
MNLPDTNPKTRFGMAKPGIYAIPPTALLHCGAAMHNGCEKYGLTNWREHEVSASVYYNAAFRHLAAWWDGEREAEDSGVHHLGHVMACCAVLLDAEHMGKLRDDRPAIPGPFSFAVAEMTKPQAEEGKQTWGGFCQDIAASAEAAFAKHEADEQLEADCEEIALRVLSTGSLDDAKAVIRAYLTGGGTTRKISGRLLATPSIGKMSRPRSTLSRRPRTPVSPLGSTQARAPEPAMTGMLSSRSSRRLPTLNWSRASGRSWIKTGPDGSRSLRFSATTSVPSGSRPTVRTTGPGSRSTSDARPRDSTHRPPSWTMPSAWPVSSSEPPDRCRPLTPDSPRPPRIAGCVAPAPSACRTRSRKRAPASSPPRGPWRTTSGRCAWFSAWSRRISWDRKSERTVSPSPSRTRWWRR